MPTQDPLNFNLAYTKFPPPMLGASFSSLISNKLLYIPNSESEHHDYSIISILKIWNRERPQRPTVLTHAYIV